MQADSKRFACPEPGCGRVLSSQADLERHVKNRHLVDPIASATAVSRLKKVDPEKKTELETQITALSKSNLSTSPTTDMADIRTLQNSVGELISDIKSSKSGLQSDEVLYARSIVEVEREQSERNQRVANSDELILWQQKLTRDFVLEFAKRSPENGEYEALELIEVLKINNVELAYFGDTEDFNVGDLMTLRELDLSENKLGALTVLHRLTQLEAINLSNNSLSVLSGLSECKMLKTLNLSRNQLDNLDDLKGLRSLEVLDVSYNKLRDLDQSLVVIQSLKHLKDLKMKGNPVQNLSYCSLLTTSNTSIRFCSKKSWKDSMENAFWKPITR